MRTLEIGGFVKHDIDMPLVNELNAVNNESRAFKDDLGVGIPNDSSIPDTNPTAFNHPTAFIPRPKALRLQKLIESHYPLYPCTHLNTP
ncbi:hypothetical protein SAMN05660652_00444 [Propionivibrio dicarboxylicus]|uniref:Uncharacterized protein n=1 Tax=Propionivibrio dicarboxylicus TaxID=83767 RepID=A0A1G7W8R8_9RHOO|nr:hypothetical protein SAMN05660652_00444 [Propionivibrio dicarboxylicus]